MLPQTIYKQGHEIYLAPVEGGFKLFIIAPNKMRYSFRNVFTLKDALARADSIIAEVKSMTNLWNSLPNSAIIQDVSAALPGDRGDTPACGTAMQNTAQIKLTSSQEIEMRYIASRLPFHMLVDPCIFVLNRNSGKSLVKKGLLVKTQNYGHYLTPDGLQWIADNCRPGGAK